MVTGFTYLEELSEVYNGKEGIRMCEAIEKMKQEAKNEGMVTLLLNQLKAILKEVSDECVQTLRKSSKEKLEELSVKILSITTEKEVLHILNA